MNSAQRSQVNRCIVLIAIAAMFRSCGIPESPAETARWALRTLARRHQNLSQEIRDVDAQLDELVVVSAPPRLLEEHRIGTETAAIIISALGDNPEQCLSESALAALADISPVNASSGKRYRHQLNRGRNRELNNAIWRIVMVRLRWHRPTKYYMQRRTAEGLTKREIVHCLKHYITRQIWKIYRNGLDQ